MAVVILSTVGLEADPLSAGGETTVALIITGVSLAAYLVTALGEYVMGGVLAGVLNAGACNAPSTGYPTTTSYADTGEWARQVVTDLRRGCPVVVIEREAADAGAPAPLIAGDATNDEVLNRAGLNARARTRRCHGVDATNVDITLSARAINPGLEIVARSSHPVAERNLTRAGATYVVSPYSIGGHRIVSELLSPGVTSRSSIP